MKFLHLSDLHFSWSRDKNRPILDRLEFIQAAYPKHKIILTGDVVDDGIENQYAQALLALQPFVGRIFACPGNHDFGLKGHVYIPSSAALFDEYINKGLKQNGNYAGANRPVINLISEEGEEPLMLLGLDTNLETLHPFDFACGEAGEGQLAGLESILNDPAGPRVKKILYFHHHPFMRNDPFMEMKDARQLMRIIYNRVHVVCFGHRHVSDKWENIGGIPYVLAADNLPGKDYAREISVEGGQIMVKDVPIRPGVKP